MSGARNGVLALWPIPLSWAWTAVSDIGLVALGRQRSPANHNGPQMRPYVRAANITWAGWDLSGVKQMNFDDADFIRFRLQPGDVLVNEGSGSAKEVGKPAIWRGQIADCCFQNTLVRVQPRGCSSEYLHAYFLYCALTERFVSKTQGINIHHIGKEGLAAFPMPVPPMPEQRRIVAKIDSLSAKSRRARAHLDHIPRLVENYKQALLAAAFRGELTREWRVANAHGNAPWDECCLADIARIGTGSTPKRGEARYYDGGTIPWVTSGAVNASLVTDAEEYITETAIAETNCKVFLAGALLMAMYGEGQTRGRVAVLGINAATNQALAAIEVKPDSGAASGFVLWYLRSNYLELREKAAGGVQPNLNLGIIKALRLPLPSLDEQREIVRRIEKSFTWIDRLAAEAVSASKLIAHLDAAILAKAFRGELVPQDPTDEPAPAFLARIRAEREAIPGGRQTRRLSDQAR